MRDSEGGVITRGRLGGSTGLAGLGEQERTKTVISSGFSERAALRRAPDTGGRGFTRVDGWVIAATGSGDPTLGEVQRAEGGL